MLNYFELHMNPRYYSNAHHSYQEAMLQALSDARDTFYGMFGQGSNFSLLRDAQVFCNQWRKQTPSGATFEGLALEPRSLRKDIVKLKASWRFALDGDKDEVWRHRSRERVFSAAGDAFTCSEVEARS